MLDGRLNIATDDILSIDLVGLIVTEARPSEIRPCAERALVDLAAFTDDRTGLVMRFTRSRL